MKDSFYILSKGELSKKDNSIEFVNKEGIKSSLPLYQINDIYLCANVILSASCLSLLAQNGISLHYFNNYEYYIGSFFPCAKSTSNGKTTINQVMAYYDKEKRVKLAKKIVFGAIKNIRRTAKYYIVRNSLNKDMLNMFQNIYANLDKAKTINEIMIAEANARKSYYSIWKYIFKFDVKFDKRTKNPPRDLVNCLISFLNSILYALVNSEIHKTSLSPTIGFLHEAGLSKLPLSYDIAEIFKPLMVDRTLFSLINKKIITEKDYEEDTFKLSKEAIKKIFIILITE